MKRFYLTGHRTFGNRGCEAIVRSTVELLHGQFDDVEVFVPSDDVQLDRVQWPEAVQYGVRFVETCSPWYGRYWVHLQRVPMPALKRAGWPFPLPSSLKAMLSNVDAVLSVGGDNYSLDYRLPSLLMGIDGMAMDLGTPVILWGASVGPFEAEPYFKPVIREHLSRMNMITVRESISLTYLKDEMDLLNVISMPDPAFTLHPEKIDVLSFWPRETTAGVLGLNISPLIQRYRHKEEGQDVLLDEVSIFVRRVVNEMNLSVLLIPHVIPPDGAAKGNDAYYVEGIIRRTGDMGGRVRLMDSRLNASQIKHVISKCRFFIGARTHSTIAALSSGVPTISISYSVKARGINQDLFGHTEYVLEASEVSANNLLESLERLQSNEAGVRAELAGKVPTWQGKVEEGARRLFRLI